MSAQDKIHNAVDDVKGKVKEGIGHVTGDSSVEAQGERDQAKADVKKTGENVKDVIKDA